MAFTAYGTATAGSVLTAAFWNQQVRDNGDVLITSIDVNGHINWLTTSKSANYLMTTGDDIAFVTSSCTIQLPSAPATGKPYRIKAYGAAVTVTVSGNGNNIDGISTFTLGPYDAAEFIYNGTEYQRVLMYRHSFITSVQYGTISITGGNATNTYTLPIPVDVDNAVVRFLGQQTLSPVFAGDEIELLTLTLTNATTVTATRVNTASGAGPIRFVVTAYVPGYINSIQSFVIAINASATSNTQTLSPSVGPKCELVYQGAAITDGSGDWSDAFVDLDLTNSTTVTAARQTGLAGQLRVACTAIDWK